MPLRASVSRVDALECSRCTGLQLMPMGRPRLYTGCAVPGCTSRHAARSYCQNHYVQVVVRGGQVVTCGSAASRGSRRRGLARTGRTRSACSRLRARSWPGI